MKTISTFFLGLALTLCAYATSANTPLKHQDLGALRQVAHQFLKTQTVDLPGKVTVEVGSIEPRLKLSPCVSPTAFLLKNSQAWGKTTVGIRCDAPDAWSIYVPANIKVHGEYLAAARSLPRGHVIQKSDLMLDSGELTALPAKTLNRPEQALGSVVAISLHPGAPIRQDALRIRRAVKQGQIVRLLSTGPGFSITSEGKAQNNATAGQFVRVRTNSGQIISGIAHADGVVRVTY